MAIIPQRQLFSWKEIENLADLQRFSLLVKYLPDEELMDKLESLRSKGRNDYPVRAIWNSILAGIVYQHPGIESLRRELMRNGQLRQLCGFDLFKGIKAVPSANAYTNFLKLLVRHSDLIDAMFYDLVEKLRDILPGFGNVPARLTRNRSTCPMSAGSCVCASIRIFALATASTPLRVSAKALPPI